MLSKSAPKAEAPTPANRNVAFGPSMHKGQSSKFSIALDGALHLYAFSVCSTKKNGIEENKA
jgi:hypothetical protein